MNKYYNTGIFKANTKLEQTKAINRQLKGLYSTWFESMGINGIDKIARSNEFNGLHLLTCFDSYISKKNKIMLYGKEANSQDGRVEIFDTNYQDDAYYTYDFAIVNPEITEKKDSYNRFFLKTRKIISGLKHNEAPSYDKVLCILNNNLNKTSLMGKYTPCYNNKIYRGKNKALYELVNQVDNIVYSEFKYNDITKNVFIHELNILRPTHLVFLCGKGYNNHIKRDFGEKFYNYIKVNDVINSLRVKDSPVSKTVSLNSQQIQNIFGLEDYEYINLIFAIHPSAHMSGDIRDKYEERLRRFIEEDTYEN